MTLAYNGRIFDAIVGEGKNFGFVWDGVNLDMDYWVIPKGAPINRPQQFCPREILVIHRSAPKDLTARFCAPSGPTGGQNLTPVEESRPVRFSGTDPPGR